MTAVVDWLLTDKRIQAIVKTPNGYTMECVPGYGFAFKVHEVTEPTVKKLCTHRKDIKQCPCDGCKAHFNRTMHAIADKMLAEQPPDKYGRTPEAIQALEDAARATDEETQTRQDWAMSRYDAAEANVVEGTPEHLAAVFDSRDRIAHIYGHQTRPRPYANEPSSSCFGGEHDSCSGSIYPGVFRCPCGCHKLAVDTATERDVELTHEDLLRHDAAPGDGPIQS